jgi:hypothetical protein
MAPQDDKEDDEDYISGFKDEDKDEDDEWSLGCLASLFFLFGVSMPTGEK